MRLVPKHWREFQHYQNRRPPWIKLHRKLLDDREYLCLQCASRALAPLLWLLASEHEGGEFEGDVDELCFRLHLPKKEVASGLKGLIDAGFLLPAASNLLAPCLQPASTLSVSVHSLSVPLLPSEGESTREGGFDDFWEAYAHRVDKKAAIKAWGKIKPDQELLATIVSKARAHAAWGDGPDRPYRKNPATWLNGECWNNELKPPPSKPSQFKHPLSITPPPGYYAEEGNAESL